MLLPIGEHFNRNKEINNFLISNIILDLDKIEIAKEY